MPEAICLLTKLSSNSSKEIRLANGHSIIVLNFNDKIRVYKNWCPHNGWPLNLLPDRFMNSDNQHIQCSNHMALFDPLSGQCVAGPCPGTSLKQLKHRVENGTIYLIDDLE